MRATWTTRSTSPSSARRGSAALRSGRSWSSRRGKHRTGMSAAGVNPEPGHAGGPAGNGAQPESGAGPGDDSAAAVADAHRREWAFVLAATARVAGDIDLAEECVQDAYVAALDAWSRRRAIDALRRESTLRGKLPLLVEPVPPVAGSSPPAPASGEDDVIPDDRLRLVFTCCHPALAREAQVALTLRLVCGLTTTEIAQAFLVPEPTMAARVTRAKKKISAARIAYRVPGAAELPDRLDAVLTVVHLLYTTGHTAPAGENVVRDDLVERALDLARMLHSLMPDEREVRGLLALLLLTDARRATRADADGRLLLLADQDRSRWNRDMIAEGTALVPAALRGGCPGRFGVQAAIAALPAEAPSYAETDWRQIVRLYDVLLEVWPSPVVALNRAAALALAEGPETGLAQIRELEADGRLADYRYLPAAKADLLRRLGRGEEAVQAYRAALALTENGAERDFLGRRIAEAGGQPGPGNASG